MSDARLSCALPGHPKMKKLIRRLHEAGAWGFVRLILWASENRTSGDLSGLTDEDLELSVDWHGDAGALISALESVGFLDGPENSRTIHDWLKHQPYVAGAEARSETSRFNVLIKHRGFDGAIQAMPEFYERNKYRYQKDSAASRDSSTARIPQAKTVTPSPSPSPNSEGAVAPSELPLKDPKADPTDDTDPPKKEKGAGKKAKTPRERNALLDALAVVGGGGLDGVTRALWGESAKALADIREVCVDVTPEMIVAAAAAYRQEWPNASVSPSALAKHWGKYAPGAKKEGGRAVQGVMEPSWDWRKFAAALGLNTSQWALLERSEKIQIIRKQMEVSKA